MEAIARQFANDARVLVIRNGWFSYRWSQILEMGKVSKSTTVMKAHPVNEAENPAYAPADIDEVTARIAAEKPAVVYAPHVETAAGLILPNDYIKSLADAAHDAGGLFVLDCIASGTLWVDMKDTGVDVLISAPQKGWSASPCCGVVMMSENARAAIEDTASSSFACNLKQWLEIMEAYEGGDRAIPAISVLAFCETRRVSSMAGRVPVGRGASASLARASSAAMPRACTMLSRVWRRTSARTSDRCVRTLARTMGALTGLLM